MIEINIREELFIFETKIFYYTVNYTTGRVDFNDSVHIVTVPAGQRVEDINVDIQIFDDEIDEADEGFVILLEVVDPAVAPVVDLSTRNTSLGRIDDNDGKSNKTFAVILCFPDNLYREDFHKF